MHRPRTPKFRIPDPMLHHPISTFRVPNSIRDRSRSRPAAAWHPAPELTHIPQAMRRFALLGSGRDAYFGIS